MIGLSESNVGVIVYRAVRKLRDGFKGGRMPEELNREKVFSGYLDRLLAGESLEISPR